MESGAKTNQPSDNFESLHALTSTAFFLRFRGFSLGTRLVVVAEVEAGFRARTTDAL